MTESSDYESVQVFIGFDVGKDTHHAVVVNRSGKRLFDKALPNDENKLRALISDLKQHGQILLIVDQPATIGALPVAVARSEGVLVGYLPGLAMRRIAEAARTLPHALRTLKVADEQIAELSMLCGFDDDLAAQTTQVSNRIRGLLIQIHPALERILGSRLDHPAVLALLQRYPSPEKLASLSEKKLAAQLSKLASRMGKSLAADITRVLTEQTVVVPGTNAAIVVLPRLARQLITLRKQRDEVALDFGMTERSIQYILSEAGGGFCDILAFERRKLLAHKICNNPNSNLVADIYDSGFYSLSKAYRQFKKLYNSTPKQYSDIRKQSLRNN